VRIRLYSAAQTTHELCCEHVASANSVGLTGTHTFVLLLLCNSVPLEARIAMAAQIQASQLRIAAYCIGRATAESTAMFAEGAVQELRTCLTRSVLAEHIHMHMSLTTVDLSCNTDWS
jgi:hypothetical protein